MLDEEMDHMIRDAAENHHPAYNDQAWDKMEKMLDKQLPQKRDRRRYIFFLLLFLLLGGGALFSVYKLGEGNSKAPGSIAQQNDPSRPAANGTVRPGNSGTNAKETGANTAAPAGNTDLTKTNTAGTTIPESVINTNGPAVGKPATGNSNTPLAVAGDKNPEVKKAGTRTYKGRANMHIGAGATGNDALASATNDAKTNHRDRIKKSGTGNDDLASETKGDQTNRGNRFKKNSTGKKNVSITASAPEETGTRETAPELTVADREKTTIEQPVAANEERKKEEMKKEEQAKEELKKKEDEKKKELAVAEKKPVPAPVQKATKNKSGNNFGITASVGPDVSFVSLNKLGKATIMYGAGLSYTFAKQRLTVRTGFYTSKKIYDAGPDQYHTPGGNYPYLYNVAAECRVYEIPLALSYNFGQHKKHSWFGSAGLSSFLMKSEYYNYEYKTPAGQYYAYPLTVKNANQHYFSVLTLSGGYNYKLSKRVSLQAEPYVKIPLGGVGNGKVKLNSGGILFTVTVKPFAKKD